MGRGASCVQIRPFLQRAHATCLNSFTAIYTPPMSCRTCICMYDTTSLNCWHHRKPDSTQPTRAGVAISDPGKHRQPGTVRVHSQSQKQKKREKMTKKMTSRQSDRNEGGCMAVSSAPVLWPSVLTPGCNLREKRKERERKERENAPKNDKQAL